MAVPTRTAYRSAFRGSRAVARPVKPPQPPSVRSPQGAQNQMTAGDQQRQALMNPPEGEQLQAPQDLFSTLPREAQMQLQQGYGKGGFEGIVNAVGPEWYDLPEWQRTQLLTRIRQ